MGDPVTPLDRRVTESLFGLSLRGTANLGGVESTQFLAEVSITYSSLAQVHLVCCCLGIGNVYDEQGNPDGWLVDANACTSTHTVQIGLMFTSSINLGVAENTLSHDLIRDFANAQVGQSLAAVRLLEVHLQQPLFSEKMFTYGDSPRARTICVVLWLPFSMNGSRQLRLSTGLKLL
jgi:hypothetical protein